MAPRPASEYFPAVHFAHTLELVWPVASPELAYVPAGQKSHDVRPEDAAKVPAAHSWHVVLPRNCSNLPFSQRVHVIDAVPFAYDPAAHLAHFPDPWLVLYIPTSQGIQFIP